MRAYYAFCCLIALFLLAVPAHTETPATATIEGMVHDGGGARVEVRCRDFVRVVTADASGRFSVGDVPAGACAVLGERGVLEGSAALSVEQDGIGVVHLSLARP